MQEGVVSLDVQHCILHTSITVYKSVCFVACQSLVVVMKVTDQVIPRSFRIINPKKFALVGQKWIALPHVIPPNVKLVDAQQYL